MSPIILIDFPDATGAARRRTFRDASGIVRADHIDEVIPALKKIQRGAMNGMWAAGFVSYEAAPAFEPRMVVKEKRDSLPLLYFGLFNTPVSDAADRTGGLIQLDWQPETTPDRFRARVEEVKELIARGETYQVNYTNRFRTDFQCDGRQLYEMLRRAQGSGFHAHIDAGEFEIISVSPELFFERRGNVVTTRPMKGTRPRGRFTEEDIALAEELHASAKDRAENLMIVDLLRNDIGRIARTGTVRVDDLFAIERYNTVWQMTSTIRGEVPQNSGLPEIFGALFPCGSVTGAPKINTMKWIAEMEDSPRGSYCGAVGVVEPGGDCAFNVAIRTIEVQNQRAVYGAGCGITADSDPQDELDEMHAKTAILRAPDPEFELIETMRCERGVILRRERHVARVMDSGRYFGFRVDRDAIVHALDAEAARCDGDCRIRMTVDVRGTVSIAARPEPARRASGNSPIERVALSQKPILSTDRFLFHKTTRRAAYDDRRIDGYFDTLLFNEHGDATEFTFGNLVIEVGDELLTPARSSGLLAGVMRQDLLDAGRIVEQTIRCSDLERATRMWHINSVREWTEVVIAASG